MDISGISRNIGVYQEISVNILTQNIDQMKVD